MLAKKKVKAERVLPTIDQLAELLRILVTIVTKIFKRMDRSNVQYWIGHERELISVLKRTLLRTPEIIDEKVAEWCRFYHEVFDIEIDPVTVALPPERKGFGWIVLVAKGLTRNVVFDLCTKRFNGKTWRHYGNLDKAVTVNDREPSETYAIRVRNRIESDEEHQGKSANTATEAGIKGMTNLERMLLELWYHWKTSDYLDKETLTICSGSRYADSYVPRAGRHGSRFGVDSVGPDKAHDSWRVRETVSL